MAKSFVRDEIGRFARTAGRRAGKKLKKAARSEADRAVDKIDAAATEKLDQLRQFRAEQAAQDALAKAERKLALAKVEMEHAEGDSDVEHFGPRLVRAQAARDKAAARYKSMRKK